MWLPQPLQVGLPQLLQVIRAHMVFSLGVRTD
jgi:hypothetical protein